MKTILYNIKNDRWHVIHSPMHCVWTLLDLKWNGKGHEKVKEFMMGFQKIRNNFFLDIFD
jgi:hypothetical protein